MQGSVLGPMLYTLYAAPLSSIVRSHALGGHLFADDSQVYVTFRPPESSDALTTLAIKDIRRWMSVNMLKLNDSKIDFLVISSPSMRPKTTIQPISVGDCLIEPSPTVRNLGVIFDQDMNLSAHVQRVCQTCYTHLRNIGASLGALTMKSAECLIHALVSSNLDFCILTCASWYEHIKPVCHGLHWLLVASRIKYKILLLVYKALHNAAPNYISDLLQHRQIRAGLRSSDEIQFVEPVFRLKNYGQRSISCVGPSYWNSLPSAVRGAPSVGSFKQRLKTYLFRVAYA